MIFDKTNIDSKSKVAISAYNVIIDEDEINSLYKKLFDGLDMIGNVSIVIKDRMFNDYLKTCIVDKFIKYKEIERGVVYKMSVHSSMVKFNMMISLHDKLDDIFY